MPSSTDKKSVARRVALAGILGAQALALAWLESLLPAFPFLPPGAKPGLSNIVTMFAISTLKATDALFVVIIKAGFAGITRGLTAFLMSLCGGLMSLAAMCLLFRIIKKNPLGLIGSGVCCALAHNLGQLIAAAIITDTVTIAGYAPALIIFGVCTGIVTGLIFRTVSPLLIKQSKYFVSTTKSTTGTN